MHGNEGYTDLGYARLDTDRAARTGHPEVVYGTGKTPTQVVGIVAALRAAHPAQAALVTRADDRTRGALAAEYGAAALVDGEARAVAVGPLPDPVGTVCVVCAGTSDVPVAAEAAFTARVGTSALVTSAACAGCAARSAATMPTTCVGVFPAPYTTSGFPVRAARSVSSRA